MPQLRDIVAIYPKVQIPAAVGGPIFSRKAALRNDFRIGPIHMLMPPGAASLLDIAGFPGHKGNAVDAIAVMQGKRFRRLGLGSAPSGS